MANNYICAAVGTPQFAFFSFKSETGNDTFII